MTNAARAAMIHADPVMMDADQVAELLSKVEVRDLADYPDTIVNLCFAAAEHIRCLQGETGDL